MIKTKLVKALLLGVCFSVFSSGIAMAESGGGQSGSFTGVEIEEAQIAVQAELSDKDKALYEKQAEVDKFLFVDHAKEIEEMGFIVTHTVVNGDLIEVGISPFDKAFADYLYDNLNEDVIHVVEGEEIMMYTTSANAEELAASSGLSDSDQATSSEDEKLEIQITSDNAAEVVSPEEQAIAEDKLAETVEGTEQEVAPVMAKDGVAVTEEAADLADNSGIADTAKEDANNNSIINVIAIVGIVGVLAVVMVIVRKQMVRK